MYISSKFLHKAFALLLSALCLMGFAQHATAEDLALIDLQGNPASLDTYRNDGKVTLLMIRYFGCGPCNLAEQKLQQYYAKQDKDKVSVLALNYDDGPLHEQVRQRLSSQNIDYPNFFTHNEATMRAGLLALTGSALSQVPLWVMFDSDGNFVRQEYNNQFDWEMMDELIMTLDSSSERSETTDATQASTPASNVPSAEDIASKILVGHIRAVMIREDFLRAQDWLTRGLQANPDHPGLLAANVRYLMLTERVPANAPLGYRFAEKTENIMHSALNSALDADPGHRQALYLQAELYATQGDLRAAKKAIDEARQYLPPQSWSIKYAESLLVTMQNKPANALANLEPLLYSTPGSQDQSFMFQRIWELVKGVAIKHPELDPLALVREGLMVRVSSSELLDEIEQRSKSKTPLVVIRSSEDQNCTY